MTDQVPALETQLHCAATTKKGDACKNKPVEGSPYCRLHQADTREPALQPAPVDTNEISEAELRLQLAEELERLFKHLKTSAPVSQPGLFSMRGLFQRIDSSLGKLIPNQNPLDRLHGTIIEDLFDVDTWKGARVMLNYTIDYQSDLIKRRMTGEYETDEWGLDLEYLNIVRPFFEFMYKTYWRVETSGMENIPDEGRALLMVNHSGRFPWDGTMVVASVLLEHPMQRLVRTLYTARGPSLPFLSSMLTRSGQVLATEENGLRLLEQDELVAAFPEEDRSAGQPARDHYQLSLFRENGFIRLALRTQAPIIPVAVVGGEETALPLPWLGPLGFIPLPAKWSIDFSESLPTSSYGPDAADDPLIVSQLTNQVRNIIQQIISSRLAKRRSIFYG